MAEENKGTEKNDKNLLKPNSAKNQKPKIDKAKLERIKNELNNDEDFEIRNKKIQQIQSEDDSIAANKNQSKAERIKQKNQNLMDEVYLKNRLQTEELAARKKENLNVILTILLFLLLIATLVMGVFLYLEKITSYDEDYIRVSVSMTNKDIFYDTNVEGELIPKNVSPGDKFNLNIVAKNSNFIGGDEEDEWTSIYLRFRIFLKVNGKEYPEFIHVEPNAEHWERYNKEIEDGYLQSEAHPYPVVSEDDGYYYCRVILHPNEQITVIDWLRFSEQNITEIVGGNKAVLEVQIEALDASVPQIIKDRTVWYNAPQHWVLYMTEGTPDGGEDIPIVKPNNDINMWYIIIFVIIAIILIVTIIYITTRKKPRKKNFRKFDPNKRK